MEAFGQIANKAIQYIIVHSYVICTFTKKSLFTKCQANPTKTFSPG